MAMNDLPSTAVTSPLEVATALYAALAADDLERAASLLHPDVVLHVPGSNPLSGDHRGVEGFGGFLLASRSRTAGGEHVEVLDLLGGRSHAAAYCRVTAEAPDGRTPLDNTTVHVLRIPDGRVAEAWFHNWDAAAVDEFWS